VVYIRRPLGRGRYADTVGIPTSSSPTTVYQAPLRLAGAAVPTNMAGLPVLIRLRAGESRITRASSHVHSAVQRFWLI